MSGIWDPWISVRVAQALDWLNKYKLVRPDHLFLLSNKGSPTLTWNEFRGSIAAEGQLSDEFTQTRTFGFDFQCSCRCPSARKFHGLNIHARMRFARTGSHSTARGSLKLMIRATANPAA